MYNLRNDTYEELVRTAQVHYQDEGMCTVIAVAKACRCSYGKAASKMLAEGRKRRKGGTRTMYVSAIHKITGVFPIDRRDLLGGYGGLTTIGQAELRLPPTGTYLLRVRGHVACHSDGVLYDWTARRFAGTGSRRQLVDIIEIPPIRGGAENA